MNIKKFNSYELLDLYGSIIEQLISRKIIRTFNNPVADFAEYLVAQRMNLDLAANSTKGYDALDAKGTRYQIKSRRITNNKSRQLGVIRNLNQNKFDYLVGVLFNRNFNILEVYKIPIQIIYLYAKFSSHQNGHILQLKGKILNDKKIENVTNLFL